LAATQVIKVGGVGWYFVESGTASRSSGGIDWLDIVHRLEAEVAVRLLQ
jgi:hypothetical protein